VAPAAVIARTLPVPANPAESFAVMAGLGLLTAALYAAFQYMRRSPELATLLAFTGKAVQR
jgi:hypothetical protein